MPVLKCSNGKYRIGTGPCIYATKAKANRAYQGYLATQREVTTSASIAARFRKKKKRKVRKLRHPLGMGLSFTMNASKEELAAIVEQAIERALERLLPEVE